MAIIRPSADLRNNYSEISKICHETNQPLFITKNGTNDLVILSDEAYNSILKQREETDEERIERLVSKHFDKHYASFEEFQKDILNQVIQALKEIEEGKGIDMKDVVAEMEAKYNVELI